MTATLRARQSLRQSVRAEARVAATPGRSDLGRGSPARAIATPDELDFDSAGRRDYLVALAHDSIWGDHLLPLTVLVGPEAEAGRGLVAFGSNHGDEYEGPVALKHLLARLDPQQVRGRIIIMPVLNLPAFRAGARESRLDDGVNLNRAFVDGAGSHPATRGITHRIAAFVRSHLWPHAHVVIDLHSGGQVAAFLPTMTFHASDEPAHEAAILGVARGFGTPLLSRLHASSPGLLFSEAHRLGKIAVSSELGWGGAVQRTGVDMAIQGVLAAASRTRQLAGAPPSPARRVGAAQLVVGMDTRASFHSARQDGHFEPVRALGDLVEAGEALGLIHDFGRIDDPPLAVIAQLGGILAAHAWGARVAAGQHVAVVARLLDG